MKVKMPAAMEPMRAVLFSGVSGMKKEKPVQRRQIAIRGKPTRRRLRRPKVSIV